MADAPPLPPLPPLLINQLHEMGEIVRNALTIRREALARLLDPRRNLEDECGHPPLEAHITAEDYQQLYGRDAIAARVVDAWPEECWQVSPLVYEEEEAEVTTPFEVAWDGIGEQLLSTISYHDEEEGSPIWEVLERVDRLSGVGRYGLLLLGLDDGLDLREPARPRKGQKLLYLRCFPESLASVLRYETDRNNPRYGHPVEYQVTFHDPRIEATGIGIDTLTQPVHHSRVLHVADNRESSVVFGTPRLQKVYDRILDLRKLLGPSAEMFYKGAFPGMALTTHPSLGGDVSIDAAAVRDQVEQYQNGLQRMLLLSGLDPRMLSPTVSDPRAHIDGQLEIIAIHARMPKRILLGSERGELASSQDSRSWDRRLNKRRTRYLTPRLVVPLVNQLISLGVLPVPARFKVSWPTEEALSEQEKTAIAVQKTQALAQYTQADVSTWLPEVDYLTRIMGFSEEEAEAMVDTARKELEEEERQIASTMALEAV